MTPDEALRRANVMSAYANGKIIQQAKPHLNDDWLDCTEPIFDWVTSDYRVRPEPVAPDEFYVCVNCRGSTRNYAVFLDSVLANNYPWDEMLKVQVIERTKKENQ